MSADEPDGFWGRWSRAKRAAAKLAPEDAPADDEPSQEPRPEPEPQPEPQAEPLSQEELDALPRIEDLTEGSDIRAFLRAGVPRDLRNAAMRRMWMLTPAIRDHADPAVDYAWDWNTPGGVPGDGVAPSPERAAEMLKDLFAPREEMPLETAPALPSGTMPESAPAPSGQKDLAQSPPPAPGDEAGTSDDAQTLASSDPEPEVMPKRRHGSALPT